MGGELQTFVADEIWLWDYPIRYGGARFDARMSVVRLADGGLLLHSPGPIDDAVARQVRDLGEVRFIVAPGNFHHLHVARCQELFPEAETWICPGVERKQPRLRFHGILGDCPAPGWDGELDQVLVRGNRIMSEVAFLHRASRTLLLVDIIENFGDGTPNINWVLVAFWKISRMWNRPTPAPEYHLGWADRRAARDSLERILAWDFDRIVIAHGDLIEHDAKAKARQAWASLLTPR